MPTSSENDNSEWGAYFAARTSILAAARRGARKLDLSRHKLTALPPEICQCRRLETLFLNRNELTILPIEIGQCTRLQTLHLDRNHFATFPQAICACTSLVTLNLGYNQLMTLPPDIGLLTSLEDLGLHDNQLHAIPAEVGAFRELRRLHLQGNRLNDVPPEIGGCAKLILLNLSGNRLTGLPIHLKECRNLTQLFLHNNLRLGLPPDILGPTWSDVKDNKPAASPQAVLDYFFSSRSKGEQPLDEVKLVLVGRGGAGKTSLAERLLHDRFTPGRAETSGIELSEWSMVGCPGGGPVTAHVWDFAGQVITHAMHVFFFSARTLYVLALTGREDSAGDDAEYWLRLIAAFGSEHDGPGPPVIVALNKWDDKGSRPRINRGALRERYPFIVDFIATDCKTGHGIDDLRKRLCTLAGGLPWVRGGFPAAWWDVKERLSRPERPHITYLEYRELCRQNGVAEVSAQDSLSDTLNRLGIALNFRDDPRLRFATVLYPQWLTGNVYTLVRAAEAQHGVLSRKDLSAILPEEDNPRMQTFLVDLMQRFEIAYPLGDEDRAAQWLVPQGLPDDQPEGVEEFGRAAHATRLRYSYRALPAGLVPRFIVRTHPFIDRRMVDGMETDLVWASGVVLILEEARALVRAVPEDRIVEIVVIGPAEARQRLAGLCQSEFRAIHGDIRGLDPLEETVAAGAWVSVQTLERDELQGTSTGVPTPAGTVQIDPTPELNGFSAPAARDESWKPRVFISYAHVDEMKRKQLDLQLKTLSNVGLLHPSWHDRKIDPGDDWDRSIKRELDEADVVLFLTSAASIASQYIYEVEMQRALDRETAGQAVVVPIILEHCQWDITPLRRPQALPKNARPLSDWKPRQTGWNDVAKGLRVLFTTLRDRPRGQ